VVLRSLQPLMVDMFRSHDEIVSNREIRSCGRERCFGAIRNLKRTTKEMKLDNCCENTVPKSH
jgi:hypothetical protein